MAEKLLVPTDFVRVRANFPAAIERQLGYTGARRWVGFHWHDEEDDVAWFDGKDSTDGTGQWDSWTRYIAPIGPYFRANLGGWEDPATHLLIWDRLEQAAYLAPRESGEEFLEERVKAEG